MQKEATTSYSISCCLWPFLVALLFLSLIVIAQCVQTLLFHLMHTSSLDVAVGSLV